jgi:hypothetical protein
MNEYEIPQLQKALTVHTARAFLLLVINTEQRLHEHYC